MESAEMLSLSDTIQYWHWWPWDTRYIKFEEDINLGETAEYLGRSMLADRIKNYFAY